MQSQYISAAKLIAIGLVPAVLPFVFFTFTVDPVLAPAFLALVVAALVGFGYATLRPHPTNQIITINKMYFVLWLVWLCLNTASLAYTSNISDNYFEIARIVLWISLLLGGSFVFQQVPNAVNAFSRGVVIACIAEAAYGFYQIAPQILLLLRNADYGYYVMGTMAHKNLFSSALMLMLPFAIYSLVRDRGFWRALAYVALAVSIIDIAILQTRAVWVALAIAGGATLLLTVIIKRKKNMHVWQLDRKYLLAIASLFIIGFILLAIFQPLAFTRQYERVQSSLNYDGPHTQANETIRERFMLWHNTFAIIKEAPFLGKGTSSWEIEMPKHGLGNTRMEQGYTFFQRPHNDFLWVLSENGLVGLCIYLLLFLLPLYQLVNSLFRNENDSDSTVLNLCLFFGITAWIINCQFDFPSERNTHFFLLLSMFILAMRNSGNQDVANYRRTIAFIALLLLLPVLGVAYLRINGEYHTRKLYYARSYQQFPAMLDEANKAKSMVYQIDPVSTPIIWYEGTAHFALQNYPEAMRCFRASYVMSPYHLPTLNNMGSTYEVLGNKDSAMVYYQKALSIAPKFEETLLNLSAIYFNRHKLDSAYYFLAQCDTASINPRYNKTLHAVLSVEVQTLINAGALSESETTLALQWKGDLPKLKELLRGALYNKISFTNETLNRVKRQVKDGW